MGRPSMIHLDKSPGSVTVKCVPCDWYAFAFTVAEGHTTAAAHEKRAHPGDYRARNAAKMYARRHADTDANV